MKKLNQKKRPDGAGAVAPASPPFDNRLSIYAGQQFVGYLLPIGKAGFQAFDSDDHLIGTYPTLKSASDAVSTKEAGRG
jgi:hypothetical protein